MDIVFGSATFTFRESNQVTDMFSKMALKFKPPYRPKFTANPLRDFMGRQANIPIIRRGRSEGQNMANIANHKEKDKKNNEGDL